MKLSSHTIIGSVLGLLVILAGVVVTLRVPLPVYEQTDDITDLPIPFLEEDPVSATPSLSASLVSRPEIDVYELDLRNGPAAYRHEDGKEDGYAFLRYDTTIPMSTLTNHAMHGRGQFWCYEYTKDRLEKERAAQGLPPDEVFTGKFFLSDAQGGSPDFMTDPASGLSVCMVNTSQLSPGTSFIFDIRDSDGDGLNDAGDPAPSDADSDGDGLPDGWSMRIDDPTERSSLRDLFDGFAGCGDASNPFDDGFGVVTGCNIPRSGVEVDQAQDCTAYADPFDPDACFPTCMKNRCSEGMTESAARDACVSQCEQTS